MNYAKPPIVEALVQLTFLNGKPWTEIEGALIAEFSGTHPVSQRLRQLQLQARWDQQAVSTTTDEQFFRWMLSDKSGANRVGFAANVLSIHVVGAYPGWAEFRPRIADAFRRYASIAAPGALAQVGIRYIDRIQLPPGSDVARYFRALPAQLPSQPLGFDDFQVTTSTLEPQSGVRSTLTLLSSKPPDGEHRDVLYDLNLTHDCPAESPPDSWDPLIEQLHQRQKDIFEESITDETRALFG